MPPACRSAAALLLFAALTSACGELTRPDPRATLTVTANAQQGVIEDTEEGPRVTCAVKLGASVSGSGQAIVRLATFRFFMGVDAAIEVDSMAVAGPDLAELWGNYPLEAGVTKSADWHFWAGAPFRIEMQVMYEQQGSGRRDSASTQFDCGPLAAAGTAPPAIPEGVLVPELSEYQVGDTIAVRYTTTSTAGIWRSVVAITGAFEQQQVFTERGMRSALRTVKFVVPPRSRLDVPIQVAVYVEDVGFQVSVLPLQVRPWVVDVTPPVLTSVELVSDVWLAASQFAVGDEFRIRAEASDDNALAWLVYELGAPANVRDSVRIGADSTPRPAWAATLTARPEWIGTIPVSAYVRDAAGNRTPAVSAGALHVYPVVERATSAVVDVPVGFAPAIVDGAHDAERNVMYLAQAGPRRVLRLDVGAMAFGAPLVFDEEIGGIDLSPGGDSLLVTLRDRRRIAVVDLVTGVRSDVALTALDTAGTDDMGSLPPGPTGIRVASTGKALVTLSHGTRTGVHVVELDLTTGGHRLRPDAGVRGFGWSVPSATFGATPDRGRLVMLSQLCAQAYVAATDAFTACSPPISGYGDLSLMSFDATATRVTFANIVLDASLHEVFRVPSPFPPPPVTLSRDGEVVYVPTSRGIEVVRVADGIHLERIPLPLPVSRLFVAPDGTWLLGFADSMEPKIVRVALR